MQQEDTNKLTQTDTKRDENHAAFFWGGGSDQDELA